MEAQDWATQRLNEQKLKSQNINVQSKSENQSPPNTTLYDRTPTCLWGTALAGPRGELGGEERKRLMTAGLRGRVCALDRRRVRLEAQREGRLSSEDGRCWKRW